jgi:cytochrome P450
MAADQLRLWPAILRPIVTYFLSSTRKVQQELREAETIIKPVLHARRKAKQVALKDGKDLPLYNDAMDWLEQVAKGRSYDPAAIQLTFSLTAIHTTTDMMTQAVYDLCERPELIDELRKEVVSVISSDGLKRTAMYKLQLMDSFLKESQRMKPVSNGEQFPKVMPWIFPYPNQSVDAPRCPEKFQT